MLKKVKVRNLQHEQRYAFLLNFLIIFIILAVSDFILPQSGPIGMRSMAVLYMMDGILTLSFMYLLEKYTITSTDLYEQAVITVLSSIYTCVIASTVNLIFFTSLVKLIADIIIAFAKTYNRLFDKLYLQ